MSDQTPAQVLSEFGGKGFGVFKPALADLLVARLGPLAADMRRYLADPAAIDAVLREGAENARAIAAKTMAEVREIVGFWRA